MPRDRSPALPATIDVAFTPYPCSAATYATIPDSYSSAVAITGTSLPDDGYDGTLTLRDTCHAVYVSSSPTAPPTNATALQTLANQIAADWWAWRTTAFDVAYAGVIAPVLDATVDEIVWTYRQDECSTRLKSAPWDSHSEQGNHSNPSSDCYGSVQVYLSNPKASVASGVLSMQGARLWVQNGTLRWAKTSVDTVNLCPS